MAILEHVEIDDLRPGMPVLIGQREFGQLVDLIPQPDRRHAARLIVRRAADVPVTKGSQLVLLEVADLSRQFELQPLMLFLADAGIRAPIDESLHAEIPRLMAALLIVVCRAVTMLEPAVSRPSPSAVERAGAVLDLTL